ncbi:MAG: bifunctional riboflavin kinase/FAD synthetase [Candidatus Latescibacteria bacterium]|nr:bifunctional riboflavin kinase/FAD synthetase [Candidatus Latescibacterota bacterium]NIO27327.1 bifunctional riboflavin kinase/FAD synthetase [Candidatus Latescibacterota bacterium]NIO54851.1 bifunctional riboflavin kinase/FAD synthetase [Candidatus Latescibacterota bacterium]NIT00934.1 bifunctional riboflavin kinase/FAD synthetase [Candidatus Latescibacterota bacterium]NIT37857.1 bifunctional riboflavin kinase/FAD synthetase [Candidatus Latescibacterota bacterium]
MGLEQDFRVAFSMEDLISMKPRKTAVTLGVFDGVHRGHHRIIESLIQCRASGKAKSCYLITFDPHPLVVTHSRITPPILTTIDERIDLLRSFPLDGVFVIQFNEEIANTDYRTFLDKYLLNALDMKVIVLGYDCRFGKNREGTPERVQTESKKRGFDVKVVPPVEKGGEVISSTHIRNKLLEGELEQANDLLGHPYTVSGQVVRGHGMGHSIGFPTANLAIEDPHKLWPPRGVYAVTVRIGNRELHGMMNIGRAPTLKELRDGAREIEVHIFNWKEDLYGENIIVRCHAFLRKERSFPSVEALVKQLQKDKMRALRILQVEACWD